uniref:Uncharacterized protein n=1 Tax=Equus caballus TaxID=9796 RepID=A0A9L0RY88_HORSE
LNSAVDIDSYVVFTADFVVRVVGCPQATTKRSRRESLAIFLQDVVPQEGAQEAAPRCFSPLLRIFSKMLCKEENHHVC